MRFPFLYNSGENLEISGLCTELVLLLKIT